VAKFVLAITGASGSAVAMDLLKRLLGFGDEIFLIVSENGKEVLEYELEKSIDEILDELAFDNLHIENNGDFFSKVASGSFDIDGMIISPCSMGTLGKIANGTSDNLIIRAADVAIKEKRRLILCVRETPISSIHLENMLKLSNIGVVISPICPLFYNRPKSVEKSISDYNDKVLRLLGKKIDGESVWNGR